MKTKTFDCVEMKRKAQERLHEEYRLRQREFTSYADFLRVTVGKDARERPLWQNVRKEAGG